MRSFSCHHLRKPEFYTFDLTYQYMLEAAQDDWWEQAGNAISNI